MSRIRSVAQPMFGSVDRLIGRMGSFVPAESRLRPALRAVRRLLPPAVRTDPLHQLIAEFAMTSVRPFFVQIGANDADKNDYLDKYVKTCDWAGVLVEPIPYVFEALQMSSSTNPRLKLVNAAIEDHDGTAQLYYLPKDDDPDLPEWYDQLATFRREVIAKHAPWIPDIEDRIATIEVPTLTFDSLCDKFGIGLIDLVQIDTEGYDYQIVKQIDLDRYRPAIVMYEHRHLRPGEREACELYLSSHGYRSISNFMDTVSIRADASDRRGKRLSRLLTRLERQASQESQ